MGIRIFRFTTVTCYERNGLEARLFHWLLSPDLRKLANRENYKRNRSNSLLFGWFLILPYLWRPQAILRMRIAIPCSNGRSLYVEYTYNSSQIQWTRVNWIIFIRYNWSFSAWGTANWSTYGVLWPKEKW